jgi:C-terminal processing protease CtpA/Prc
MYAMFLTQSALDRFDRTKAELELGQATKKPEADSASTQQTDSIAIELDGIEDRFRRLTIHSSDMADAHVTPDGTKLVYLARFESGYDLWVQDLRERETKLLAKLNVRTNPNDVLTAPVIALDSAGTSVFVLSRDGMARIALSSGERTPVALQAEMVLDPPGERQYLFEHVWRQVHAKFYDPSLHGADWDGLKADYARFVPHITNNYDFAEMLGEMLGELNASHTGARYRPMVPGGDQTSSLGLLFDQSERHDGLRITEVINDGPLDRSGSRVRAGHVVTAIDGASLTADANLFALLNGRQDEPVLLSLRDPATGDEWEEVTRPISLGEENELLYRRWVERRRAETERLSNGRLGYVHVRAMDGASFRTVYSEALGRNADKEALIVDTRFNGGGWLHDDLVTFLDGVEYVRMAPRGDVKDSEPAFKWKRPSVVLMSESNYSDGHFFPWAYKTLEIGELVGMPVPGTATAVWWERLQDPSLVFGIPQVGMLDADDRYLENLQLEPDHEVWNDWASAAEGRDKQLEKAVEVLLGQLRRTTRTNVRIDCARQTWGTIGYAISSVVLSGIQVGNHRALASSRTLDLRRITQYVARGFAHFVRREGSPSVVSWDRLGRSPVVRSLREDAGGGSRAHGTGRRKVEQCHIRNDRFRLEERGSRSPHS